MKVSEGMLENAVAERALMMKMKDSVVVAVGGGSGSSVKFGGG